MLHPGTSIVSRILADIIFFLGIGIIILCLEAITLALELLFHTIFNFCMSSTTADNFFCLFTYCCTCPDFLHETASIINETNFALKTIYLASLEYADLTRSHSATSSFIKGLTPSSDFNATLSDFQSAALATVSADLLVGSFMFAAGLWLGWSAAAYALNAARPPRRPALRAPQSGPFGGAALPQHRLSGLCRPAPLPMADRLGCGAQAGAGWHAVARARSPCSSRRWVRPVRAGCVGRARARVAGKRGPAITLAPAPRCRLGRPSLSLPSLPAGGRQG